MDLEHYLQRLFNWQKPSDDANDLDQASLFQLLIFCHLLVEIFLLNLVLLSENLDQEFHNVKDFLYI